PVHVQSRDTVLPGSEFDENRVYEQLLDPAGMAALAAHKAPSTAGADTGATRACNHPIGGHRPAPPALPSPPTPIRTLECADT
ncbi:hypothetical protein, partial [Stenotrophomonas sp. SrG]|uniref:hypothetical protein n=1 Tax=Stenotrophomonas sp. SrG TaxID=3414430 RepID=UPI003CEF0125